MRVSAELSLRLCHIGSKYGLYGDAPHQFIGEVLAMMRSDVWIDLACENMEEEINKAIRQRLDDGTIDDAAFNDATDAVLAVVKEYLRTKSIAERG